MEAAVADMAEVVGPRWLESRLAASWLRVVDVRTALPLATERRSGLRLRDAARTPFEEGHVPGAVSLDVNRRLLDAYGAVVWAPEVARAMSDLGVGDEHTIVIVDDEGGTGAILQRILRGFGHKETFLLAGGFGRWAAEGRAISRKPTRHPPATFTTKMA